MKRETSLRNFLCTLFCFSFVSSPCFADGHKHRSKRGMVERFTDPENWAKKFDDPERYNWQKPDEVISALGLRDGQSIVDLGAGTGYFAVRLAKKYPKSTVLGIDREPEMVDYLNRRALQEKLLNLRALLASSKDARIPGKVDLVFICNTYHHFQDRKTYLKT
ncbi:MAG: class I SAM-dependent methyltransferase [Myxococcales bacterium]|nr:MAG: class I SAM-dependent methyltransferase [Myxococcales bacterium]